MLSAFKRMAEGVLAVMGEDSLLRGAIPCKVNIEHGVQVVEDDGISVVDKIVATVPGDLNPKVGDTLTHPDGNFKLDVIFNDPGVNPRFIVIRVK